MDQRGSSEMLSRVHQSRSQCLIGLVVISGLFATAGVAQTARGVRGAAAVEPLQNEPAAKIVIDPPLAEPLSHGRVVIQYRTENLHLAPVFGPAALAVSPRVGHVHVSLDDSPWVWVDTSGEPVIANGLTPGPHKSLNPPAQRQEKHPVRAHRPEPLHLRPSKTKRRQSSSSIHRRQSHCRAAFCFSPIVRSICKSCRSLALLHLL